MHSDFTWLMSMVLDREATVEACYDLLRELSRRVRERYGLREGGAPA